MRYTGITHTISYEATLDFFEARGRQASTESLETATMYQDRELAMRRDRCEQAIVTPLLAVQLADRLLDIGCGAGRWAAALEGAYADYLGIDFSAELLKLAEARSIKDTQFQRLGAQEISAATLRHAGPFDVFICSGILIYLNDDDVTKLASQMTALAAPGARVYLREPMAVVGGRLTLDRFQSEELKSTYSAIYRTPEQVHELFGAPLRAAGFRCVTEQSLYPPELCNRKETEQQIQLWLRHA